MPDPKPDVRIVKVGGTPPPRTPSTAGATRKQPLKKEDKKPKFGILKGGKTARKAPRFKPVRDPAKSPPVKHRSSTLNILTEKGLTRRRKEIERNVQTMPIAHLRVTLRRSGLPISDKTPEPLLRQIAAGGMEAGMIPV